MTATPETVTPETVTPETVTPETVTPETATPAAIRTVGVVGAGQMGAGIAEVCARAGLEVLVHETDPAAARAGRSRIDRSLTRAEQAGKITTEERERALARITTDTDIEQLGPCDLVIEAVSENADIKYDVFRRLDKVVTRPDALLASNTSSLPIMRIAMVTRRPEQVVGLHFFNPVPVLRLVEVVPSLLTSQDTLARARTFAAGTLGKTVITAQDRAGFIVNSLLIPYLLSAVRMLESGFADADDIDNAMVLGCAHPMGPLRLCDLIGLDTVRAIAEAMYEEFKEPLYAPVPLLLRMVEAGLTGKKAGRGFHDHRRP